ncbi:MAG: FkbM family methyltransferase [Nocardioidaceae bacterium]
MSRTDTRDPADAHYLLWARYTASQARQSQFSRKEVDARVEEFFRDLCRMVEPTVGLELGAHQADFSAWLKETFSDARSLALEANPYVFERYRKRLADSGVEYRHLAVGAKTGTLELMIPIELGKTTRKRTNRMASLNVHRKTKNHESVAVDAVRLDDLVSPAASDRVVVWIDVEGAADQVLEGGRDVLSQASAVYMEVESSTTWHGQWLDTDVARYFADLGLVPVMRDIQRPHQYNVVYVDRRLAARPEVARRAARVLTPPRRGFRTKDAR